MLVGVKEESGSEVEEDARVRNDDSCANEGSSTEDTCMSSMMERVRRAAARSLRRSRAERAVLFRDENEFSEEEGEEWCWWQKGRGEGW